MIGYIQLALKNENTDKYLIHNPIINNFLSVYYQFVNFATNTMDIFSSTNIGFGKTLEFHIPRAGDFLSKTFFEFELPALQITSGTYAAWTNNIGHAIIDSATLYINNEVIDKHLGLYLEIWHELTEKRENINFLLGKFDSTVLVKKNGLYPNKFSVALKFWFNVSTNSALPIFLMSKSPIRIDIKLRQFEELVIYDGNTPPNKVELSSAKLIVDYIIIDKDRELRNNLINHYSKNIIMEQVQYIPKQTISSLHVKTKLTFNLPIKEIIWVFVDIHSENNNDWFNYSRRNTIVDTEVLPFLKCAKLTVENIDRTDWLDEYNFRLLNTYKYHTNTTTKHIYCLPFCSLPENIQPSGYMNFSSITDAILCNDMATTNQSSLYVFGKNINWYSIKNGLFKMEYIT